MRLGYIVGVALLVPAGALAQSQWTNPFTGTAWDNPLSKQVGSTLLGKAPRKALQEKLRNAEKKDVGPALAAKPKHPPTATDFKGTGTRLIAEKLAESAKTDEERGRVRDGVEKGLATFERQSRKDNVASGLGFLIGAAAQVGYARELGREDLDEIVRIVNDGLAESKRFKKMKARSKQEIYEASIITGGIVAGLAAQAKQAGDAEAQEQVRQLAFRLLLSLGIQP